MFITSKELHSHLYPSDIELISDGDNTLLEMAIQASIMQAQGYLESYDTATIFSCEGAERNALLVMFVKDIAVWHFINLCNVNCDLDLRQDRYNNAIKWLENVQKGKIQVTLPFANNKSNELNRNPSSLIAFGSNVKRHNHL